MTHRFLAILLFALALAACGQSGPLYVPGDPSQVKATPPPVEEQKDDDEDDEP